MRSLKTFTRIVALAVLGVFLSIAPTYTQATMTATTFSAAVSATTKAFTVTSATGFAVGSVAFADTEAMQITAVSGTTITVIRGYAGTAAAAHASGAVVWVGLPSYYSGKEPAGVCTSTSEVALPRIVLNSGNIYDCKNSTWVRWALSGYPQFGVALLSNNTYTASGAITIQPGVHFINGTTLAMTLANPTTAQNGMILIIVSTNASAHTLTYTAGFDGGTTARDVATFGGAIGDNIVIFANNGVWWVISTRNVTLA
jgi:hypothetical protein